MADDWPEHGEELARKALSVFEKGVHAYLVEDQMSRREMRVLVDTLCDVTQGLIPEDAWNTIYQARKEMEL